jgi:hypothetical protein
MVLQVGDIQFVSNTHLLHARTAYIGKTSLLLIVDILDANTLQTTTLLHLEDISLDYGSLHQRQRADGLFLSTTARRRSEEEFK